MSFRLAIIIAVGSTHPTAVCDDCCEALMCALWLPLERLGADGARGRAVVDRGARGVPVQWENSRTPPAVV